MDLRRAASGRDPSDDPDRDDCRSPRREGGSDRDRSKRIGPFRDHDGAILCGVRGSGLEHSVDSGSWSRRLHAPSRSGAYRNGAGFGACAFPDSGSPSGWSSRTVCRDRPRHAHRHGSGAGARRPGRRRRAVSWSRGCRVGGRGPDALTRDRSRQRPGRRGQSGRPTRVDSAAPWVRGFDLPPLSATGPTGLGLPGRRRRRREPARHRSSRGLGKDDSPMPLPTTAPRRVCGRTTTSCGERWAMCCGRCNAGPRRRMRSKARPLCSFGPGSCGLRANWCRR